MRFGAQFLGKDLSLSIVFGNGVNALVCDFLSVDDDYIVVRGKTDGLLYHVPVSSIVYVRINA